MNATVHDIPIRDARQYVYWTEADPPATVGNGAVNLYIARPAPESYSISIRSKIDTSYHQYLIHETIPFPLHDLDNSLYSYLQPTETIDITPEIRNTASDITAGKTDLYAVEYALAEYVRSHVQYDLSTLNNQANQKSSWVLANKRGVCNEITILFISLNRALGIPARFVSGYAYTNLDIFGTDWVPHAWAEVYFPGYGWIAYDVTYGEYGYLDAGHITFERSFNSKISSVAYEYLGQDATLQTQDLASTVRVLETGGDVSSPYTFTTTLSATHTGLVSYNVIAAEVTNPNDYYMVADLYLADTQDIIILDPSAEQVQGKSIHRKEVLLEPHAKKTVDWIIKLDNTLTPQYQYTFPIVVYNSLNASHASQWIVRDGNAEMSYATAREITASTVAESSRPYSASIALDCTPAKTRIYPNEPVAITCSVDNKGDRSFTNVKICLANNCTIKSFGITTLQFTFTTQFNETGTKTLPFTVSHDQFFKANYITIAVVDHPNIMLSSPIYPARIAYDTSFNLSFIVEKHSESIPENITLTITGPMIAKQWTLPALQSDQPFIIDLSSMVLRPGANNFTITVTYQDAQHATAMSTQTIVITPETTAFQDIVLYARYFLYKTGLLFQS